MCVRRVNVVGLDLAGKAVARRCMSYLPTYLGRHIAVGMRCASCDSAESGGTKKQGACIVVTSLFHRVVSFLHAFFIPCSGGNQNAFYLSCPSLACVLDNRIAILINQRSCAPSRLSLEECLTLSALFPHKSILVLEYMGLL